MAEGRDAADAYFRGQVDYPLPTNVVCIFSETVEMSTLHADPLWRAQGTEIGSSLQAHSIELYPRDPFK